MNVLKAACLNPVLHYKLDVGLLRINDPADFIIVNDLKKFQVDSTYINGSLVAKQGVSLVKTGRSAIVNNFSTGKKESKDFEINIKGKENKGWIKINKDNSVTIDVIEALDGQLITNRVKVNTVLQNEILLTDTENNLLKLVVVNRYSDAPVAKAFIRNFGLKSGALASSVAHDSHNIVAVGVDDDSICKAVNLIIENKGGVSLVNANAETILPLPVAGLMSNEDGYKVAEAYSTLDKAAKKAGSTLGSPFMTLSFMALLVIPHLKLSDKGLFDGDSFEFL
jgi:adenine deaminase